MIFLLMAVIFTAKSIADNVTNSSTSHPSLLNFTYSYEENAYSNLANHTRNATNLVNFTGEDQNFTEIASNKTEIETTSVASSEIYLGNQFSNSYKDNEIPCVCDLLSTVCDVNCCCDKQCSKEDYQTFTDCGMPFIQQESRYCFRENFVFFNNTPYVLVETSNHLFCIYTDNFRERLTYRDVQTITSASIFEQTVEKYQAFSWPEHINNTTEMELKVGAPVYVQYTDGSFGYLAHLRSLTSGECITSNPAAYMVNADDSCHQYITELERDCSQNIWLNGRTYFQGFQIIRNPETMKNNKNISDDDLVEIEPQLCLQISELELKCNMVDEQSVPAPFYDKVLGSCSNAVTRVEYKIMHDSTQGIDTAVVHIALGTINEESSLSLPPPIKWMQNHGIIFKWANENYTSETPIRWSGNPGYHIGSKILAGKLTSRDIDSDEQADVRLAVQMSQDDSNWLTILGASPLRNGQCASQTEGSAAGRGRISVTFGTNIKTGCVLAVSLQNLSDACTVLQTTAMDALLGWNPPDVVGAYGNSKVEKPGEWVPILRQNFPGASRSVGGLTCTNIVREMHVTILYAKMGSLANPQPKIVGVQVRFSAQNELKLRCIGRYCQSETESLTQTFPVTTSVTFVDVSEAALQVYAEAPTLHVELPNDFFYPFSSSSSALRSGVSYALILCVSYVIKIAWTL